MMCASDICAKSSGGDSGGSGGDEHKMCTSYEQNVEHCKKDGVSDVDDIADGIGKVDVSDKEAVVSSAIKQAEVAQKGDQNQRVFTDYVQDEISSIYSEKRDYFDNMFKAMELSDPEIMNHPKHESMKEELYKQINEEEINNKKLFQPPPPKEECPICILPMPFSGELDGRVRFDYQFCCGKRICTGCIDAAREEVRKGKMKDLCPFCRIPNPRSEKEDLKRCRKRMKLKDAYAIYELGDQYYNGRWGLPQHLSKACELWNQAAELGSIHAHCGLGDAYMRGAGVEQDAEKARYHFEIAAIGGHENARHGLYSIEWARGNNKRLAMNHLMLAARSGYEMSMKGTGEAYKLGHITKEEYAATLRAYKESYDEMESVHRAAAAAARKPTNNIYSLSPEDRAANSAKYEGAFTRSKKKKKKKKK